MKRSLLFILSISIFLSFQACFRTQNLATNVDNIKENKKSIFEKQTFKLHTVEDLYQFLTYNENRYPLVSAHRGGPLEGFPENAIETFEYWANKGPIIIECDVRMTKDSVLIMMHDEDLNRTTTGKGKVSDFTFDEIKALKLVDNNKNVTKYNIPTLQEVLAWGKGKVLFTLDVKQDVPYTLLSNMISRSNAQSYAIVITYSSRQADALHRINPDVMISVSIKSDKDLNKLVEFGIPDNRLVAFIGTAQPKPELVERLHAHGIQTILGTIGNLDRQAQARGYQTYAEHIENGADILSTDHPAEAKKALDFYIRKRNISSPYINN